MNANPSTKPTPPRPAPPLADETLSSFLALALAQLSAKDRHLTKVAFSSVSRSWWRAAGSDRGHGVANSRQAKALADVLRADESRAARMRTLVIEIEPKRRAGRGEAVAALLDTMPSLEELYLTVGGLVGPTWRDLLGLPLRDAMGRLAGLKRFRLAGKAYSCRWSIDLAALLPSWPLLQDLEAHSVNADDTLFPHAIPKLRRLSVPILDNPEVVRVLLSSNHIEEVQLGDLSRELLQGVAINLDILAPRLRRFQALDPYHGSHTSLHSPFLASLQTIDHLHLGTGLIDGALLKDTLSKLPCLRTFLLQRPKPQRYTAAEPLQFTPQDVNAFIETCESVKCVKLIGMERGDNWVAAGRLLVEAAALAAGVDLKFEP